MHEVALAGCTATPLAAYLKALGVLRLLSMTFPDTRAAWRGNHLVLRCAADEAAVERFLLQDYQPTPVIAPWNGGSGFFEEHNRTALQALEAIRTSTSPRLVIYRECVRLAEQALASMDLSASPKNSAKAALLVELRGLLPDEALEWLDACVLVSGDSPQFPPLLGTGGNDGRLDFTNNFMQRLCEVLSPMGEAPSDESVHWLRMALYGEPAPGLVKKAIGQFSPGQAGGPNATTGFKADPAINPWDFVLMIEGALSFAAAATRRNAHDPEGSLSYPFTVCAVGAGAGNLGEGDAASSHGELWLPLWRHLATYSEIRTLLGEGRVALGRKAARDALDFVRAVHRLGGYRGVDGFLRYGFLKRSGDAYLATPLAHVEVNRNPDAEWLDDLDQCDWLTHFRRFAQGDKVAKRFLALRRQLEDALFNLASRAPTPAEVQSLLVLLGDVQAALGTSGKAREILPPVPSLSEVWVRAADDGTAAFRIARALAGLMGSQSQPLPLRAQLFPVHPENNRWTGEARKTAGNAEESVYGVRIHTDLRGNLVDTLVALLTRRLWLADRLSMRDKPLSSPAGVGTHDLLAFLRSGDLDHRIAGLLPGLSLCRIPKNIEHSPEEGVLPAAFALLKLVLTPDATLRGLRVMEAQDELPVPPGLVAHLAAGNAGNRSVRAALRRLRASRLSPLFAPDAAPELGALDARRTAAALLIPLRFGAVAALVRGALKAAETDSLQALDD